MNVPLIGVAQPIGFGDVIATIVHGMFGIPTCSQCQARQAALNRVLTFVPWLWKG